jgi:Calx-beta domain
VERNRIHRWIACVAGVALVAGAMSLPVAAAPKKPTISINDAFVTEGDSGETILSFTLHIKGARTSGATVNWTTADATATSPDDYGQDSGTVSFAAGKQRPIRISVKGDEIDEDNETFLVNLSDAVNANISRQQGVGTILDDDDPTPDPTLSISDDTVGEGNTGTTTNASFEVTLSKPAESDVTVDFATVDGSATEPADYAGNSGSLTFAPGDTTRFVTVGVNGDNTSEPDEDFRVTLSGAAGATIPAAGGTATGTIVDDEGSPAVSVEDAPPVTEGDTGTTNATFEVTLSHDSSSEITVDYATVAGTALVPDDFQSASGTVTFAAGDTSEDVNVPVVGDIVDESDERFTLDLSNPQGALAADMEGKGFITDDDTTRVSVSDTSATEGSGPAAFTIRLTKPSSQDVGVAYETADGTAKATTDYVSKSATLSFAAGETSETLDVGLINDRVHEPRETFSLSVNQTFNAELGDGVGTATVRDNDRAPTTTTLKARKRSGRVLARGRLSPAHKGRRMAVTLKKRKSGRWVNVRTKRPLLSGRTDINGDGVRDSTYRVRFFNPRNTKRCRVIARFPGDLHHRPSKARKTFNC